MATAGITVATGGACGGRVSSSPPAAPTTALSTTSEPAEGTTTTTLAPSPPVPGYGLSREGGSGPAVSALQGRLLALGYWAGPVDGKFGDSTVQAVYALQKAAGITVDGVVGPETAGALASGITPSPRSTSGHVIEVDLRRGLLMFVDGGKVEYTLNTSTGGGYVYTQDGVSAVADTPQGHFTIFRQVDGLVVDTLGELWRPKYFYAGFAIHGDSYVPPAPVSHGCVRVSDEAIDWIWASDLAPLGTSVWVYDQ